MNIEYKERVKLRSKNLFLHLLIKVHFLLSGGFIFQKGPGRYRVPPHIICIQPGLCCHFSVNSLIYFFIFIFIFSFFKKFIYFLFIYFWLCWVFIAVYGLSLVVASGGYSSLRCAGFSLWWLLLLQSMGSRRVGFSSCGTRAQ